MGEELILTEGGRRDVHKEERTIGDPFGLKEGGISNMVEDDRIIGYLFGQFFRNKEYWRPVRGGLPLRELFACLQRKVRNGVSVFEFEFYESRFFEVDVSRALDVYEGHMKYGGCVSVMEGCQ